MAFKKPYTAGFFKRVKESDCHAHVSKLELGRVESDSSSEDEDIDLDKNFKDEDRIVAKLYREVVDDMMDDYKLKEACVNEAISEMKSDIHAGHKNGFRRFEIDFRRAANRCGYLRRYAVCHTGLVKKAIWRFLAHKVAVDGGTVFDSGQLKVVSLGGGPGCDLVGFCSALQETGRDIKKLDLKVVDISQGWVSVFSSILKVARNSDFGNLSKLLKKSKITTGFLQANLNSKESYEEDTFCSVLGDADIVLMVKVLSFISHQAAESIIQKVVDCMHCGSLLMFVDQPYDHQLFQRAKNLRKIYQHYLKYELSFRPARYLCPAIDSSQASIGVFEKNFETEESDSFDSDTF